MSEDYSLEGKYVSVWLGQFENQRDFAYYVSTIYDLTEDELEASFSAENQHRSCEEDERDWCREFERFNQFKYDFALAFDEDFCEGNFLRKRTNDVYRLIGDTTFGLDIIKAAEAEHGRYLSGEYNTVIALLDYNDDEDGVKIGRVQHEYTTVTYLGSYQMINPFKDFVFDSTITVGDRVSHPLCGEGLVVTAERRGSADILEVEFDEEEVGMRGFAQGAYLTKL